jgi:4-hydroxyproline epimerase
VFEASYRYDNDGRIIPRIAGSAFVTAEAILIIDEEDGLGWGIEHE